METRLSKAQAEAKHYIDTHNLEQIMKDMLNALVHAKDPKPELFMLKYFLERASPEDLIAEGLRIEHNVHGGHKEEVKAPHHQEPTGHTEDDWDSSVNTKMESGGSDKFEEEVSHRHHEETNDELIEEKQATSETPIPNEEAETQEQPASQAPTPLTDEQKAKLEELFSKFYTENDDSALDSAFEIFDSDHDKKIDINELTAVLSSLLGTEGVGEAVQKALDKADVNHNGVIDIQEFIAVSKSERSS